MTFLWTDVCTYVGQCQQHPMGGSGTVLGTTPPGAAAGLGTTLADRDLPSVMTCANYLKLPPYSCKVCVLKSVLLVCIHTRKCVFSPYSMIHLMSTMNNVMLLVLLVLLGDLIVVLMQEVMRERLLYAICEGQGSFDLS